MQYSISNEYLTVTASELGAELRSIRAADGTEYLWQGEQRYWGERSPILFPFVGRLYKGSYTMDGKEYSMGIHGFAKSSLFSAEQTGDSLVFTLADSEESYALYPRRFRLKVVYKLSGKRLSVRFEVFNLDSRVMYFGLGGHPGFNVPLKAGLDFTDYRVSFHETCAPRRILVTENGLISGETVEYGLADGRSIPLRHELFDNDAVVLRDTARGLSIESDGDSHCVTVCFPQIPVVGFWHMPRTDAPYVCVEPWISLPADEGRPTRFEEKSDLIRLAPGHTYANEWYIEIDF